MATSKQQIIKSIKSLHRPVVPLPVMSGLVSGKSIFNVNEQVKNVEQKAKAAHIEVFYPNTIEEINSIVHANYPLVKNIFCNVEGVHVGTISLNDLSSTQQLNKLELSILEGCFVVEENAAVWITEKQMQLRSVITAAEFLMLVVRKENIVHNMHDAYNRIDLLQSGYGVFIYGPSKTADIEQTLVIGAHGAKKTALILI